MEQLNQENQAKLARLQQQVLDAVAKGQAGQGLEPRLATASRSLDSSQTEPGAETSGEFDNTSENVNQALLRMFEENKGLQNDHLRKIAELAQQYQSDLENLRTELESEAQEAVRQLELKHQAQQQELSNQQSSDINAIREDYERRLNEAQSQRAELERQNSSLAEDYATLLGAVKALLERLPKKRSQEEEAQVKREQEQVAETQEAAARRIGDRTATRQFDQDALARRLALRNRQKQDAAPAAPANPAPGGPGRVSLLGGRNLDFPVPSRSSALRGRGGNRSRSLATPPTQEPSGSPAPQAEAATGLQTPGQAPDRT